MERKAALEEQRRLKMRDAEERRKEKEDKLVAARMKQDELLEMQREV